MIGPARAARLLGAAQALREAIAFPLPCRAVDAYGRPIGSVHGCLGERSFAEAWLAGLRLSVDEAIAEATSPTSWPGTGRPVTSARPGPRGTSPVGLRMRRPTRAWS